MTTPQIGETMKYLKTGGLFQVKKVANDFVILTSQDGSEQIMTRIAFLDSHFEKIIPADSLRDDFSPNSRFNVLPNGLERWKQTFPVEA
jgi:hypothetical protein